MRIYIVRSLLSAISSEQKTEEDNKMFDMDGMSDYHSRWDRLTSRFIMKVIPAMLFVGLPLLFLVMIVAALIYAVVS